MSDSDFVHATADGGAAYIVMLAIESLLAIIGGLESLTVAATEQLAQPAGVTLPSRHFCDVIFRLDFVTCANLFRCMLWPQKPNFHTLY